MAIIKPTITIDGNFSDWISSERIDYGDVTGYSLYSEAQNGFLYFDLNAPTGVAIGSTTTIWLNTDLNAATGYQIFGFAGGAEYNVEINADGTASLYQDSAGQTAPTLVLSNISIAYSADKTQVELAIPLTSIGNPSNPVDVLYDVNNSTFGPTSYTNQPYVAPNADVTRTPTHKVAIVYSDTTAANYFRGLGDAAGAPSTAYDDLFMAAQNQARMAGVSYDIIDESQLTNVNNLIGYDALIFPSMTDVNTAQLPAIMSALTSAVYDYHISIITSGDFLTNDQTGAPLAGNPYVNMETLLGLNRVGGGNSGNVSVTANDLTNPAMKSYTAGQVIQTYTGVGYTDYEPVGNTPKDVLVNQSVTDPTLAGGSETIPGVTETTVGGTTNVRVRLPGAAGRQQSVVERHPERGVGHHSRGRAAHLARCRHRCRAHGHGPGAGSCRRVAGRRRPRHLRQADPDPAAVEVAVRLRRIVLRRHRRQPDSSRRICRRPDDNRLGEEPAVLSSRSWRWAARSARTPTPISSTRPPRRSRRTPSATRRRARRRSPSTRCRRSTASRSACGSPARVSARTRRCQAPPAKAVRWPTRRSPRSSGQHHHHQLRPRRFRRHE